MFKTRQKCVEKQICDEYFQAISPHSRICCQQCFRLKISLLARRANLLYDNMNAVVPRLPQLLSSKKARIFLLRQDISLPVTYARAAK